MVGLEPTTLRLTADRSTIELLRIFNNQRELDSNQRTGRQRPITEPLVYLAINKRFYAPLRGLNPTYFKEISLIGIITYHK